VSGSDSDLNPGKFHWSDGTEVDDALWDKGQPSSFGPGYQTCVFLYTEDAKLGDYRFKKIIKIMINRPECPGAPTRSFSSANSARNASTEIKNSIEEETHFIIN